jgi:hypothetical protein
MPVPGVPVGPQARVTFKSPYQEEKSKPRDEESLVKRELALTHVFSVLPL